MWLHIEGKTDSGQRTHWTCMFYGSPGTCVTHVALHLCNLIHFCVTTHLHVNVVVSHLLYLINGGDMPKITLSLCAFSRYTCSVDKHRISTTCMGLWAYRNLSMVNPRPTSQGRYTPITPVTPIHAVDIYLVPWHWALYPSHPWAVASFIFCPVAIAAGSYPIYPLLPIAVGGYGRIYSTPRHIKRLPW